MYQLLVTGGRPCFEAISIRTHHAWHVLVGGYFNRHTPCLVYTHWQDPVKHPLHHKQMERYTFHCLNINLLVTGSLCGRPIESNVLMSIMVFNLLVKFLCKLFSFLFFCGIFFLIMKTDILVHVYIN